MSRMGMDVGVIRADADQMDHLADALQAVIASANAVVARMHGGWLGPDAEQLVSRWQQQSRPALDQVTAQIRHLATRARSESQQQDAASSVAGNTTGRDGVHRIGTLGVLGTAAFALGRFNSMLSWITRPRATPEVIRKWDAILGHPRAPQWLTRADKRLADLSHALGSRATSVLPHHLVNDLRHVEPIAVSGVSKWTGRLGTLGNVTTLLGDSTDLANAAQHGDSQSAVYAGADGVADAFKSTKTPGLLYLAGVDVAVWTDAAREANQIDWSQGLPAPTPSNLYHLYGPAFGDAVKSLPSHLIKDLW